MRFRPVQIQYAWYERFAMRLLFAWILEKHIPGSLSNYAITAPHGLARFVDLHFLLDPEVFQACRGLLWLALVLYILGIGWSIVLPYITLLSIAVGSIHNSQGAIGHHLQIVPLVLLAQCAAHFCRGRPGFVHAEDRLINWSQQAIAATYFISALTKLLHTKGMWFFQSPLVAVQIIKTTDQDYYNSLDPTRHEAGLALAEWMVHHPLLVAVTLSLGLLLELTTPFALLGRGWALFYGLALLAFHETVGQVMRLNFIYNEHLLWIYFVNVPFWIVGGMLWTRQRFANQEVAGSINPKSPPFRR